MYNSYLFNANIGSFSIYCNFGQSSHFVNCQYLNFSNILHFSNVCQWEFDIIIIFNAIIALVLQMFRIWLINPYLILKLLVFTRTCNLYNDRHLSQNYYFFLLTGLSYYPNNLLYSFGSSYPFYPSELSYIGIFYSWNQKMQHHGIDRLGSLPS